MQRVHICDTILRCLFGIGIRIVSDDFATHAQREDFACEQTDAASANQADGFEVEVEAHEACGNLSDRGLDGGMERKDEKEPVNVKSPSLTRLYDLWYLRTVVRMRPTVNSATAWGE
jgi:hypothetical protein